jgi:UDP-GlcNAc:undecaprenyl-phosphate/decaprenyl-phosphate GlcNAc-1-phosphate transferase
VALIAFVASVIVAVIATPLAARLAGHFGIVDRPGPLKVHAVPVPYLGGVAVLVAVAAGAVTHLTLWLVAPALACFLGLADDLWGLDPRVRFVVEAGIGALAGVIIGGSVLWGLLGSGCTLVLVNAVNLLDGLDGLAAGVCAVSALGLAALGRGGTRFVALALAGALVGFLVYNRPPARIYLGDSGSYLIGGILAGLLVAITAHTDRASSAIAVLPLVVGFPLVDTAFAVVRRIRTRRPLFTGDRSHIYDQLVDRGRSVATTSGMCIAAQMVVVGFAVLLSHATLALCIGLELGVALLAVFGLVAAGFARPAQEVTS